MQDTMKSVKEHHNRIVNNFAEKIWLNELSTWRFNISKSTKLDRSYKVGCL